MGLSIAQFYPAKSAHPVMLGKTRRAPREENRKGFLTYISCVVTKMLRLQPSMMCSLSGLKRCGECDLGVTRRVPAGAGSLGNAGPSPPPSFVQHVRMVACGGAVVVFLGQELR